jgi:predicted SPOUT superfamily RNA methylase MTH1
MKTYRVTTVLKTVHIYNVEDVRVVEDVDAKQFLEFRRVSSPPVRVPLINVVSYEATV